MVVDLNQLISDIVIDTDDKMHKQCKFCGKLLGIKDYMVLYENNFIENIPLLLEKFSSIEFEFKDGKKKPGLSWLIDKENWSAVLNGDFDKHTEGECQNEYNPCL